MRNPKYQGKDSITLTLKYKDSLPKLLAEPDKTGKQREVTAQGIVFDDTSDPESASAETMNLEVVLKEGDGFTDLKVTSGGPTWGNESRSFTLEDNENERDIKFTVQATHAYTKGDPTTSETGWNGEVDGNTITWTLDPYLKLRRKSYKPPAS